MKKISPVMVEAGVAALQNNAARMGEPALASKVYSVMEAARLREEASRLTAPGAYVHQAFPGWRYGPNGERAEFACAEDVPEGWAASAAEATATKPAKAARAKVAA